jgi:ABC-2 type transport system permease protein
VRLDRMLAIAKKNLKSLRRDRRTFAFIFMVPLMMMLVFGYTFGGDVKNIKVSIVNLDEGFANDSYAWSIIDELNASETLKITEIYTAADAGADPTGLVRGQVERGEVWAAIVFGSNFTQDAKANLFKLSHGQPFEPSNFTAYLDATNPNVAVAVQGVLQQSLQTVLGGIAPIKTPLGITTEKVYGEDTKFIDFFAPGIMVLAGLLVTFILTIVAFVRERTTSTLERILTTPVTEGEVVGGYALSFALVTLAQSTVILVTAILLFNIQVEGSVLLALFIIFLLGVGSMGMGLLFSAIAKNELQAVQFVPMVFIPSILLAGIFWPLEAVPEFLRPLSYLLPPTYAVDAARSVMIRGWGIEQVWVQIVVLAAFALAMLFLSTLTLKRRK